MHTDPSIGLDEEAAARMLETGIRMTGGMCDVGEYLLTKKRLRNTFQFSLKTSASSLKFLAILGFPLQINRKRPFLTTFCRQKNTPIFKKNIGSSPSPSTTTTQECFHYVPANETLAATLTRWRKPQKDVPLGKIFRSAFRKWRFGAKKKEEIQDLIYESYMW